MHFYAFRCEQRTVAQLPVALRAVARAKRVIADNIIDIGPGLRYALRIGHCCICDGAINALSGTYTDLDEEANTVSEHDHAWGLKLR